MFYREIVQDIINISMELASSEASQLEQESAIRNIPVGEQQMRRLNGVRWENTKACFIMMNDDGTITPIFKEPQDMNKNILKYFNKLKIFQSDLVPFRDLAPQQVINKIKRMCSNMGRQKREFQIDRISFTRDNFLKLTLIYLRIRAGIPVIIMGKKSRDLIFSR